MTEQHTEKSKIPTWVWILLAGAIVVSLVLGCAIGAVGGFFASHATQGDSIFSMRGSREATPLPNIETPKLPRNRGQATPQAPSTDRLPAGTVAAIVQTVVEGAPAQKAGLKVGDFITAVDGVSFNQDVTLSDLITEHKPGDTVTLTLAGRMMSRERTLEVTLGQHPDDPTKAYLGIEYSQFEIPDISNGQQDQDNVN